MLGPGDVIDMVRQMSPLQRRLADDVEALSQLRTALIAQLADVEHYRRQAIALAAMHGIRPNQLAELSGLTPSRVSQIATRTDVSDTDVDELRTTWDRAVRHPDVHLEQARQAVDASLARRALRPLDQPAP